MADPTGASSPHSGSSVDPFTAFWRDVWARSAASMPNPMAGAIPNPMGGAMPGFDPQTAAAMFSPEAMRRMQAAFYDAMAQQAEQTMRSPQFLEAMKRSMDQALQVKRQMDDFLKSNLANAFETATGGANTEILAAIRQSSAQLQAHLDARIDRIEARVERLEQAVSGRADGSAAKPVPPVQGNAASGKKNK